MRTGRRWSIRQSNTDSKQMRHREVLWEASFCQQRLQRLTFVVVKCLCSPKRGSGAGGLIFHFNTIQIRPLNCTAPSLNNQSCLREEPPKDRLHSI